MSDPDGLALALWFALAGLGALAVAGLVELYQGREMRKRQRRRAALERYLGLIHPRQQP